MGACALAPRHIEVDFVDTLAPKNNMSINSTKCVHDLRRAVAEMKQIAPHKVEVMRSEGSSKKVVGHNEPLSMCASRGRISVTVTEPNVSFFTSSADGTAKQYDAITGECVATYPHPAAVNSICLSKCGCFVYTACSDGACRKFDDRTATLLQTYKSSSEPLYHVALSPCGKFLFTCTAASVAQKFDERTGALVCAFNEHVSGNASLALSTCGKFIYKTTTTNVAKKYNWQTGEVLAVFENDETSVLGIALGHSEENETMVFVACADGSVKQFNEAGTCVRTYNCHTDRVTWIGCRNSSS